MAIVCLFCRLRVRMFPTFLLTGVNHVVFDFSPGHPSEGLRRVLGFRVDRLRSTCPGTRPEKSPAKGKHESGIQTLPLRVDEGKQPGRKGD